MRPALQSVTRALLVRRRCNQTSSAALMQWPSPSPAGLGLEAAYEVDGRFGDVAAGRAVIHCGCSPRMLVETPGSRAGPAGDPLGPLLEPEERTPRNRNPRDARRLSGVLLVCTRAYAHGQRWFRPRLDPSRLSLATWCVRPTLHKPGRTEAGTTSANRWCPLPNGDGRPAGPAPPVLRVYATNSPAVHHRARRRSVTRYG
jgi:hypothetical protein